MARQGDTRGFLDGPGARVLALLVAVAVGALLAYLNRATLFGITEPVAASPEDAAFHACYDQRAADIDKMVADGVVDAGQAQTFKTRAEAMCRDTSGGT